MAVWHRAHKLVSPARGAQPHGTHRHAASLVAAALLLRSGLHHSLQQGLLKVVRHVQSLGRRQRRQQPAHLPVLSLVLGSVCRAAVRHCAPRTHPPPGALISSSAALLQSTPALLPFTCRSPLPQRGQTQRRGRAQRAQQSCPGLSSGFIAQAASPLLRSRCSVSAPGAGCRSGCATMALCRSWGLVERAPFAFAIAVCASNFASRPRAEAASRFPFLPGGRRRSRAPQKSSACAYAATPQIHAAPWAAGVLLRRASSTARHTQRRASGHATQPGPTHLDPINRGAAAATASAQRVWRTQKPWRTWTRGARPTGRRAGRAPPLPRTWPAP